MTPSTPPVAAFAFDIDGVLTQGSNALPQAKRILNYLSGYNPWKLNFPFVLSRSRMEAESLRDTDVRN
ncbi:hypothetical protein FRC19_005206 [Serendipita sp. 401]|nr:hypothetical protein FRC19_005206 [Serendipita sp. 401]